MNTRTPGGLMKNMCPHTGSIYDATIFGTYTPANPLIKNKTCPSMDFDGMTNYLSLANPFSGLQKWSLVFWINPDTRGTIVWSRAGAAGTYAYLSSATPYPLQWAGAFQTPSIYGLNATHMLVITGDGSTLNGRIYDENQCRWRIGAVPATLPVDANCFIGQYWDGTLRLNCRLDNMMFWNVTLTESQIKSIIRSANPRM